MKRPECLVSEHENPLIQIDAATGVDHPIKKLFFPGTHVYPDVIQTTKPITTSFITFMVLLYYVSLLSINIISNVIDLDL